MIYFPKRAMKMYSCLNDLMWITELNQLVQFDTTYMAQYTHVEDFL